MTQQWTLHLATTTYTVGLPEHRRWAELRSWGPAGVEDGPSPLANVGRTPYLTEADGAPVEYAPFGLRPFAGADLVAGPVGAPRESWWTFDSASYKETSLRLTFADQVTGLRTDLYYEVVPGTDVLLRWTELTNTGSVPIRLERFDSAGFCLPVDTARVSFLIGRWCQEFQLRQVVLPAGRFEIDSRQGVAGHGYSPWLAVQDDVVDGPTWGFQLVWPGSWRIDADIELSGSCRVRVGRQPHEGAVLLAPGATMETPRVAAAYSADGLGGLAQVWHSYERHLSPGGRQVLYNSWEATEFAVDAAGQLELAKVAADIGAELFVVDDGWFVGRDDDTGGLGDWTPDPAKFPAGFGSFVSEIRALGLEFGLWVEPEAISPRSRLYAEHPDWVYHLDGRAPTLIRNQLLLDLGRDDVFEFVLSTLDGLLSSYPIRYLKWDMNRPPTERGRPGSGDPEALDLDGAHARNYLRILDHLRAAHPSVAIEGCAGGGGRVELATISRTDVVWPSDNTGPLDRLSIQYGFLHAHAPHVMSSWVTDAAGVFDQRPRSLRFRFVLAMAGALGIGADIRSWTPGQRAEAARYVAQYKELRPFLHSATVTMIGTPADPTFALQYTGADQVVVLAWNTGPLDGTPALSGRRPRLRLSGLDSTASYGSYSGAHLMSVGLPVDWTSADADVIVLERS
ncbi:alpha-galactosidase [Kutzneria chonburiensis]|uniref:Alpha-galactosidase n=1 Tax=Kutzneria chonburiensis TaxID=1483604 RepID=A0ABV6N8J9_9PSEU|nr:alpha-galactosidase [Kutzneria chonburiensis]